MRWLGLFVGIILLVSFTACADQPDAEPRPPTIHYGEEICEACGMIISDARFASAYITADGTAYKFDEVAGMVHTYLAQEPEVIAFFVHDYHSQDWLRGEEATYVLAPDMPTPMGFGLLAFASLEQAEAFTAGNEATKVMDFEALISHYQHQPLAFPGSWPAASQDSQAEPATQHKHSQ